MNSINILTIWKFHYFFFQLGNRMRKHLPLQPIPSFGKVIHELLWWFSSTFWFINLFWYFILVELKQKNGIISASCCCRVNTVYNSCKHIEGPLVCHICFNTLFTFLQHILPHLDSFCCQQSPRFLFFEMHCSLHMNQSLFQSNSLL